MRNLLIKKRVLALGFFYATLCFSFAFFPQAYGQSNNENQTNSISEVSGFVWLEQIEQDKKLFEVTMEEFFALNQILSEHPDFPFKETLDLLRQTIRLWQAESRVIPNNPQLLASMFLNEIDNLITRSTSEQFLLTAIMIPASKKQDSTIRKMESEKEVFNRRVEPIRYYYAIKQLEFVQTMVRDFKHDHPRAKISSHNWDGWYQRIIVKENRDRIVKLFKFTGKTWDFVFDRPDTAEKIRQRIDDHNKKYVNEPRKQIHSFSRDWDRNHKLAGLPSLKKTREILERDKKTHAWLFRRVSDNYNLHAVIKKFQQKYPKKTPIVSKGILWTAELMKEVKDAYNKTAPKNERIDGWRDWDKWASDAGLPPRDTKARVIVKQDEMHKDVLFANSIDGYDLIAEVKKYKNAHKGQMPVIYNGRVWTFDMLHEAVAQFNETSKIELTASNWKRLFKKANVPSLDDRKTILDQEDPNPKKNESQKNKGSAKFFMAMMQNLGSSNKIGNDKKREQRDPSQITVRPTNHEQMRKFVMEHNHKYAAVPNKQIYNKNDWDRLKSEFGLEVSRSISQRLGWLSFAYYSGTTDQLAEKREKRKSSEIKIRPQNQEDMRDFVMQHNAKYAHQPKKQLTNTRTWTALKTEFGLESTSALARRIGALDFNYYTGNTKLYPVKIIKRAPWEIKFRPQSHDDMRTFVMEHNEKYKDKPTKQLTTVNSWLQLMTKFALENIHRISSRLGFLDFKYYTGETKSLGQKLEKRKGDEIEFRPDTQKEMREFVLTHNEQYKDQPEKQIHTVQDWRRLTNEFHLQNLTDVASHLGQLDFAYYTNETSWLGKKIHYRSANKIKFKPDSHDEMRAFVIAHNEKFQNEPKLQIRSYDNWELLKRKFELESMPTIAKRLGNIDFTYYTGEKEQIGEKRELRKPSEITFRPQTHKEMQDYVIAHNIEFDGHPELQYVNKASWDRLSKQFQTEWYKTIQNRLGSRPFSYYLAKSPESIFDDFKNRYDQHNELAREPGSKLHPFNSMGDYARYAEQYGFETITEAQKILKNAGSKSWIFDLENQSKSKSELLRNLHSDGPTVLRFADKDDFKKTILAINEIYNSKSGKQIHSVDDYNRIRAYFRLPDLDTVEGQFGRIDWTDLTSRAAFVVIQGPDNDKTSGNYTLEWWAKDILDWNEKQVIEQRPDLVIYSPESHRNSYQIATNDKIAKIKSLNSLVEICNKHGITPYVFYFALQFKHDYEKEVEKMGLTPTFLEYVQWVQEFFPKIRMSRSQFHFESYNEFLAEMQKKGRLLLDVNPIDLSFEDLRSKTIRFNRTALGKGLPKLDSLNIIFASYFGFPRADEIQNILDDNGIKTVSVVFKTETLKPFARGNKKAKSDGSGDGDIAFRKHVEGVRTIKDILNRGIPNFENGPEFLADGENALEYSPNALFGNNQTLLVGSKLLLEKPIQEMLAFGHELKQNIFLDLVHQKARSYSDSEIRNFLSKIESDPVKAPVWNELLEKLGIKPMGDFSEMNDPIVKKFYQLGLYVHKHETPGTTAKLRLVALFWNEIEKDFKDKAKQARDTFKLATDKNILIFGERGDHWAWLERPFKKTLLQQIAIFFRIKLEPNGINWGTRPIPKNSPIKYVEKNKGISNGNTTKKKVDVEKLNLFDEYIQYKIRFAENNVQREKDGKTKINSITQYLKHEKEIIDKDTRFLTAEAFVDKFRAIGKNVENLFTPNIYETSHDIKAGIDLYNFHAEKEGRPQIESVADFYIYFAKGDRKAFIRFWNILDINKTKWNHEPLKLKLTTPETLQDFADLVYDHNKNGLVPTIDLKGTGDVSKLLSVSYDVASEIYGYMNVDDVAVKFFGKEDTKIHSWQDMLVKINERHAFLQEEARKPHESYDVAEEPTNTKHSNFRNRYGRLGQEIFRAIPYMQQNDGFLAEDSENKNPFYQNVLFANGVPGSDLIDSNKKSLLTWEDYETKKLEFRELNDEFRKAAYELNVGKVEELLKNPNLDPNYIGPRIRGITDENYHPGDLLMNYSALYLTYNCDVNIPWKDRHEKQLKILKMLSNDPRFDPNIGDNFNDNHSVLSDLSRGSGPYMELEDGTKVFFNEFFDMLLANPHLNPNLRSTNGITPLNSAAKIVVIKKLLQNSKVDPDIEDASGRSFRTELENGKYNSQTQDESREALANHDQMPDRMKKVTTDLRTAIESENYDNFINIWSNPDTNKNELYEFDYTPLRIAWNIRNIKILSTIYSDPDVNKDIKDVYGYSVEYASSHWTVNNLLLDASNYAIENAIRHGDTKKITYCLENLLINYRTLEMALRESLREKQGDAFKIFVSDPRIKIETLKQFTQDRYTDEIETLTGNKNLIVNRISELERVAQNKKSSQDVPGSKLKDFRNRDGNLGARIFHGMPFGQTESNDGFLAEDPENKKQTITSVNFAKGGGSSNKKEKVMKKIVFVNEGYTDNGKEFFIQMYIRIHEWNANKKNPKIIDEKSYIEALKIKELNLPNWSTFITGLRSLGLVSTHFFVLVELMRSYDVNPDAINLLTSEDQLELLIQAKDAVKVLKHRENIMGVLRVKVDEFIKNKKLDEQKNKIVKKSFNPSSTKTSGAKNKNFKNQDGWGGAGFFTYNVFDSLADSNFEFVSGDQDGRSRSHRVFLSPSNQFVEFRNSTQLIEPKSQRKPEEKSKPMNETELVLSDQLIETKRIIDRHNLDSDDKINNEVDYAQAEKKYGYKHVQIRWFKDLDPYQRQYLFGHKNLTDQHVLFLTKTFIEHNRNHPDDPIIGGNFIPHLAGQEVKVNTNYPSIAPKYNYPFTGKYSDRMWELNWNFIHGFNTLQEFEKFILVHNYIYRRRGGYQIFDLGTYTKLAPYFGFPEWNSDLIGKLGIKKPKLVDQMFARIRTTMPKDHVSLVGERKTSEKKLNIVKTNLILKDNKPRLHKLNAQNSTVRKYNPPTLKETLVDEVIEIFIDGEMVEIESSHPYAQSIKTLELSNATQEALLAHSWKMIRGKMHRVSIEKIGELVQMTDRDFINSVNLGLLRGTIITEALQKKGMNNGVNPKTIQKEIKSPTLTAESQLTDSSLQHLIDSQQKILKEAIARNATTLIDEVMENAVDYSALAWTIVEAKAKKKNSDTQYASQKLIEVMTRKPKGKIVKIDVIESREKMLMAALESGSKGNGIVDIMISDDEFPTKNIYNVMLLADAQKPNMTKYLSSVLYKRAVRMGVSLDPTDFSITAATLFIQRAFNWARHGFYFNELFPGYSVERAAKDGNLSSLISQLKSLHQSLQPEIFNLIVVQALETAIDSKKPHIATFLSSLSTDDPATFEAKFSQALKDYSIGFNSWVIPVVPLGHAFVVKPAATIYRFFNNRGTKPRDFRNRDGWGGLKFFTHNLFDRSHGPNDSEFIAGDQDESTRTYDKGMEFANGNGNRKSKTAPLSIDVVDMNEREEKVGKPALVQLQEYIYEYNSKLIPPQRPIDSRETFQDALGEEALAKWNDKIGIINWKVACDTPESVKEKTVTTPIIAVYQTIPKDVESLSPLSVADNITNTSKFRGYPRFHTRLSQLSVDNEGGSKAQLLTIDQQATLWMRDIIEANARNKSLGEYGKIIYSHLTLKYNREELKGSTKYVQEKGSIKQVEVKVSTKDVDAFEKLLATKNIGTDKFFFILNFVSEFRDEIYKKNPKTTFNTILDWVNESGKFSGEYPFYISFINTMKQKGRINKATPKPQGLSFEKLQEHYLEHNRTQREAHSKNAVKKIDGKAVPVINFTNIMFAHYFGFPRTDVTDQISKSKGKDYSVFELFTEPTVTYDTGIYKDTARFEKPATPEGIKKWVVDRFTDINGWNFDHPDEMITDEKSYTEHKNSEREDKLKLPSYSSFYEILDDVENVRLTAGDFFFAEKMYRGLQYAKEEKTEQILPSVEAMVDFLVKSKKNLIKANNTDNNFKVNSKNLISFLTNEMENFRQNENAKTNTVQKSELNGKLAKNLGVLPPMPPDANGRDVVGFLTIDEALGRGLPWEQESQKGYGEFIADDPESRRSNNNRRTNRFYQYANSGGPNGRTKNHKNSLEEEAFILIAGEGNLDQIRKQIPNIKDDAVKIKAIIEASKYHHISVVEELIIHSTFDQSTQDQVLSNLSKGGKENVLRLMKQGFEPSKQVAKENPVLAESLKIKNSKTDSIVVEDSEKVTNENVSENRIAKTPKKSPKTRRDMNMFKNVDGLQTMEQIFRGIPLDDESMDDRDFVAAEQDGKLVRNPLLGEGLPVLAHQRSIMMDEPGDDDEIEEEDGLPPEETDQLRKKDSNASSVAQRQSGNVAHTIASTADAQNGMQEVMAAKPSEGMKAPSQMEVGVANPTDVKSIEPTQEAKVVVDVDVESITDIKLDVESGQDIKVLPPLAHTQTNEEKKPAESVVDIWNQGNSVEKLEKHFAKMKALKTERERIAYLTANKNQIEALAEQKPESMSMRKLLIHHLGNAAQGFSGEFRTYFASVATVHIINALSDDGVDLLTFLDILQSLPTNLLDYILEESATMAVGSVVGDWITTKMMQQHGKEAFEKWKTIRPGIQELTSTRRILKNNFAMMAEMLVTMLRMSPELTAAQKLDTTSQNFASYIFVSSSTRKIALEKMLVPLGLRILRSAGGKTIFKAIERRANPFLAVALMVSDMVWAGQLDRYITKIRDNAEYKAGMYEAFFRLQYWLKGGNVPGMVFTDVCYKKYQDDLDRGMCYMDQAILGLDEYRNKIVYAPVHAVTAKYMEKQKKLESGWPHLRQLNVTWEDREPIFTTGLSMLNYKSETTNLWSLYHKDARIAEQEVRSVIPSAVKTSLDDFFIEQPIIPLSEIDATQEIKTHIELPADRKKRALRFLGNFGKGETLDREWKNWHYQRVEVKDKTMANIIFKNDSEWMRVLMYSINQMYATPVPSNNQNRQMIRSLYMFKALSLMNQEVDVKLTPPTLKSKYQNGYWKNEFSKDHIGPWGETYAYVSKPLKIGLHGIEDPKEKAKRLSYSQKGWSMSNFYETLSVIFPVKNPKRTDKDLLSDVAYFYKCKWDQRTSLASAFVRDKREYESQIDYQLQKKDFVNQRGFGGMWDLSMEEASQEWRGQDTPKAPIVWIQAYNQIDEVIRLDEVPATRHVYTWAVMEEDLRLYSQSFCPERPYPTKN